MPHHEHEGELIMLKAIKREHEGELIMLKGHNQYMYIAPGQEPTTPARQNFNVNKKALSLCPNVASF